MMPRRWQPDADVPKLDNQRQSHRSGVGQPNNTQTTHLEKTGQEGHRTCHAVSDIHAVIGHQIEAARQQAQ